MRAFLEVSAVLGIAESPHFQLEDGIFLQSLVLRLSSIVWKSAGPEQELARKLRPLRISLGRARGMRLEPNSV